MLPTNGLLEKVIALFDFKNPYNPEQIEAALRMHLANLGSFNGPLRQYGGLDNFARDARDARDARAARDAWAAWDARAARAARDARAARAARDAWAAWDARAARAARAAWAAWDARDARDARAAWDAWDARDARDVRAAWDASWCACLAVGAHQIKDAKGIAFLDSIIEGLGQGLWFYFYTPDNGIGWLPQPQLHLDERRRLHANNGAAFILPTQSLWFWKGVLVTQQIIEQPDTLTPEQVMHETNAEVRRVMIERLGLDRFLSRAEAQPIHTDEHRALYKIVINNDEPIVAVKVQCPSTGQIYFLRVPPQIDRCDKAVAWTFGFETVRDYQPVVET